MIQAIQVLRFHLLELEKVSMIVCVCVYLYIYIYSIHICIHMHIYQQIMQIYAGYHLCKII